ncbi:Lytic murein transglycosylase [Agrobacterium deltaense Zutra 3/1]|uniref:Lytic murein transglycosylase n=2 Tax=Agrobacterium deltaense TaxID=1183412 RepID=A0A1S7QQJ9_9HYPH|nr:Lytic murein transglycosylase [Agrobacterium deltaense Zutra 3/1]
MNAMSSLIDAIRAAVLPGSTTDVLMIENEGETGAKAPPSDPPPFAAQPTTGGDMTVQQSQSGPASAAAGTIAAVVTAASSGDSGFTAAMGRINTIVSADGIKGDAGRLNAAIELATASPQMTAEAVIAFVSANVPAAQAVSAKAGEGDAGSAKSYEQQRLAAANLAMPAGASSAAKASPKINRDAIFAARRNQTKGE